MKKPKGYLPKYRLASEEFSSDDLNRLARNIVSYEENHIFYTKIVPISILILAIISFFVLR